MDEYKIKTLHKAGADITVESAGVYSYPIHTHSYYEMTLYEPFDGVITLNDCVIVPDKPTAILVIPSDFHKISVKTGKDSKYIKLSFASDCFDSSCVPKTSMVLDDINQDSFFLKIYNEILQCKNNEVYKKALVNTAICFITQRGQSITLSHNTKLNRYGIEAIKIINENFTDDITLLSVAGQLNITPQYLSNIFKADVGMSFSKYLTSFRLRHAEKLLAETDESITKICEMCGYGNFSHFLRSFKKVYGLSPSVHRKSNR